MENINILHGHLMPVYLVEVKHTGDVLIVHRYGGNDYDWICDMQGENGVLYKTNQLNFIKQIN